MFINPQMHTYLFVSVAMEPSLNDIMAYWDAPDAKPTYSAEDDYAENIELLLILWNHQVDPRFGIY